MPLGGEDAQGQSLAGDVHPADGITGLLPSKRRRKPNADAPDMLWFERRLRPDQASLVLRDSALLGIPAHPGLLVSTCPSRNGRVFAHERGIKVQSICGTLAPTNSPWKGAHQQEQVSRMPPATMPPGRCSGTKGESIMKPGYSAVPSLLPYARPDGSCLGRHPEEKSEEESVPAAPAGQEEPPVNPAEPMNPA